MIRNRIIDKAGFLLVVVLMTGWQLLFVSPANAQTKQSDSMQSTLTITVGQRDEVYNYIVKNWKETVVSNPHLPEPFFAAWKTSPTYFYFDNYFINRGVLEIGSYTIYAKNAIDDAVYLINQLGFVPNFNDPPGQTRSQTPYLSMMVRDVYQTMPKKDDQWLRRCYDALLKEYRFWTNIDGNDIEDHSTAVAGLQRFGQHATREELISFYKRVLPGRLGITDTTLTDREKAAVAAPYVAEAEAMDFTPRFDQRAPDFIAVDLNSNLFLYEENFAWMEKMLNIKSNYKWKKRAEKRKNLIQKQLWDEERGLFMDYDFKNRAFGRIACLTSVSPLFTKVASPSQAKRFVENLSLFEYKYGVSICEKNDYPATVRFQFDYPASWAAFTMLTVIGLDNYGYKKEAKRIAEKFLNVVVKNFFYPEPKQPGQFLYEKYNAVTGEIDGAGYGYGLNRFFGFTAGGFVWCYNYVRHG